jgi:hypothetical protein
LDSLKFFMRSLITLILFASLTASAQSLSGPVQSFLFDAPTESLRAVDGFPGSATFGPVLLSDVEFGSVAPYKNYAIALKDGHWLFVSGLDSAAHVSTSPLPGVFGRPEGVAWSSDGSVAILYSISGNSMQTLTGLPGSPHANAYTNLSVLAGSLTAVASDADGKQIAIAMQGPKGGVYLTTSKQEFVPLAKISNPIALSFSENGSNLYVLDRTALELTAITISNWNSEVLPLTGLSDPFAILARNDSANQPVLFVVSGRDRLVGVYNLASQKMEATLHLGFQPTGIHNFGPNSLVIGLRSRAASPLWLFSTAPKPAVYFVPAAQAATRGVE